jgi:hypothetical protein
MTAHTFSASQREAWQTRSGLGWTDAERTDAGGLGVSPTSKPWPVPRRGNRAKAGAHMRVHCLPNLSELFKER